MQWKKSNMELGKKLHQKISMALWLIVCKKCSKGLDDKICTERGKDLCQKRGKKIGPMYATKRTGN